MSAFLEVDRVDRIYPLANGGKYIALKNIDLKIKQGEFVSLVGHSGCGKSTLLNMVAGLDLPTHGGVILEGKQITAPGPDRMVVFQNYSLLPWLTVRENIALAVDEVYEHKPKGERKGIVEHHIELVGLTAAATKKPGQLSGGMKQRVAIARALAIRPKVLLLDEPFGALDALTRGGLQEQLMKICEESKVTCIMVTHDVDEALLLSDRIVLLTNGPEAHIGQILSVPMPHPRHRLEVVKHPQYYKLRNEIVYFLNQQKKAKKRASQLSATGSTKAPEKGFLNIGFVPLTDAAPLIIAKEKGFFAKHGIEQVNLYREPSWNNIAEGISTGRLDAAQMAATMPLALTIGMGGKKPLPVSTAMVLSRNGDGITLSKELYQQGVRNLKDLKRVISETPDRIFNFGVVHPASMQNLLLRYWLASGGIDPDKDVNLAIVPPSQMVQRLKTKEIDGYCVGAPWNSLAVRDDIGFVVATDLEIWRGHPEKVLGVKEEWANNHPQTHLALVKAMIEACQYCDDPRYREEIADLIALPQYLDTDPACIRNGFIEPYDRGNGEEPQLLRRYPQFHIENANCPQRVEGLWILTQLARWGTTPFPRNWLEILERVRRVDIFGEACRELGLPDIEPDRESFKLFDGMVFNPDDPIGYLKRLEIVREFEIEEIAIDLFSKSSQNTPV
jgi:nitrate ABC transporter ATP-binding subunit